MCDPIGMIGMAFSIGSQVMQMQAQQDVMQKQQQANDEWLAYQRTKARQSEQRQEAARKKADMARTETLGELTSEKQTEAQKEEQARLEGEYMPTRELTGAEAAQGPPGAVGDNLMLGAGANPHIQQSFADAVTGATRQARERMQNLATVQSFTGSQFGLANRANALLGDSQDEIKLQGDIRQGDLVAYGVAKAVSPVKYAIGSGAGAFGGIAQGLAGMAGKAMGAGAAGGQV